MTINLAALRNVWPHVRQGSAGLTYLVALVIDGAESASQWSLDPDYQRGHVWTREQQEAFVGYALEGGPLTPIWVNRSERTDEPEEVIDGKQRLTALLAFMAGHVRARLSDGRLVTVADLDEQDRRMLPLVPINYVDLTRKERLDLYLRLNAGGTIHSEAELARVRELRTREG